MKTKLCFLLFAAGITEAQAASPAAEENQVQERLDRSVDQVALAAQHSALEGIQSLLGRYRGTPQEPRLLSRLGEAWQEAGALEFRLAHGRAHRGGAAVQLEPFQKAMKASVKAYDQLIRSYPKDPEIHEAYFARAKAYDELNEKTLATKDYEHLVKNFPEAQRVMSARMRLGEYAIDDNLHEVAIRHLEEVEKRPQDPHYPFALYKLGWSHYNLQHFRKALGYLERHVEYYSRLEALQSADTAMRENTLMDIALFRYEGFEKKQEGFDVGESLNYFHGIESGPLLGKMLARYSRLLRAGGFEHELLLWKNLVLAQEPSRPETLEVIATLFEDRLGKRSYARLGEVAGDWVTLYRQQTALREHESFEKARQLLASTMEELQKLTVKNKGASEVAVLAGCLEDLSLAFAQVVSVNDERRAKARFNLAETYFQIRNFEKATLHYRWIVEHASEMKGVDVSLASLRALASRYETLRGKSLIPETLAAKDPRGSEARVDPLVKDWIQWIDAHEKLLGKQKTVTKETEEVFRNYVFEANRALYASGDLTQATERLQQAAEKAPESAYAIPSASLVLDTAVASQDWERSYETARRMGSIKAWRQADFGRQLKQVEADSFYKLAEADFASKRFAEAVTKAESCRSRYAQSERESDCRLLGARAWLALGKDHEARSELDDLIARAPASAAAAAGLVNRAGLLVQRQEFSQASRDYAAYLEQATEKDPALREAFLVNAWLGGDSAEWRRQVSNKKYCESPWTPSLRLTCLRLTALDRLNRANTSSADEGREELIPEGAQALWSLVRLQDESSSQERYAELDRLSKTWNQLGAGEQLSAMPDLVRVVPSALDKARLEIKQGAVLKANKKSLEARLAMIRRFEESATRLMTLPSLRLRAEVLQATAESYLDLSSSIQNIPAPKGLNAEELAEYTRTVTQLSMPFEEKAQEIRRRAYESALANGIERESFDRIAEAFYRDNPSQAKQMKLEAESQYAKREKFELASFLKQGDPDGHWEDYSARAIARLATGSEPDQRGRYLRWAWRRELELGHWPAVAWFLSEAQRTKTIAPGPLALMQAATLRSVGSQAESWPLIEKSRALRVGPLVAANQGGRAQ